MFGKEPRISPLAMRKRLLIAESEINRAQLSKEWETTARGVHDLAHRAKTIAVWGSSAALLAAGVTAMRRRPTPPGGAKSSWLRSFLAGARVASTIWLAFRGCGKKEEPW